MPLYLYKHPSEEKYVEVVQGMNDKHEFFDSDGVEWERRWTVPYASVSSQIDPFDRRKQIEKTGNMKGTVGDLWDFSREMSEMREDKLGHEDPVKRKYFDDYEKRNKVKHTKDRPTKIETKHATIDLSNPLKTPKLSIPDD